MRHQPFSLITLISFRCNKNIRDNLVRNTLRQNLPAPAGTFSCSRARCYTCSFLNSATSISRPKSNFVIWRNFTCTSSNIIYCISCMKCCKLYIGETGRRLSDRFAEHLRPVRKLLLTSLLRDILMLLTTLFPT